MSAVLKGGLPLARMREADLPEVLAVEGAIYSHPWTRGNFFDSIRAGYQCWTWRHQGELVGYFILLVAAGEGAQLNVRINAAYLDNRDLADGTVLRAKTVLAEKNKGAAK
mgnify:CR=1 FL=1